MTTLYMPKKFQEKSEYRDWSVPGTYPRLGQREAHGTEQEQFTTKSSLSFFHCIQIYLYIFVYLSEYLSTYIYIYINYIYIYISYHMSIFLLIILFLIHTCSCTDLYSNLFPHILSPSLGPSHLQQQQSSHLQVLKDYLHFDGIDTILANIS